MELLPFEHNRWAISNGAVTFTLDADCEAAIATCDDVEVEATVTGGVTITLPVSSLDTLFPDYGTYSLVLTADENTYYFEVERVSVRYTDRKRIEQDGLHNGDNFADTVRYPDTMVDAAILAAEEAIEDACERSFCTRRVTTTLFPASLVELPVVDVTNIECDLDDVTLVSYSQVTGITEVTEATITYGAKLTHRISAAVTRLAESYLRARVTAENARGTSVDGVYVSYELATGEEGSWTGLPFVDAVIEANRAHRPVIH